MPCTCRSLKTCRAVSGGSACWGSGSILPLSFLEGAARWRAICVCAARGRSPAWAPVRGRRRAACRARASRFGANGSEPHLGPWSDPWNHAVSLRGRRRAEPRLDCGNSARIRPVWRPSGRLRAGDGQRSRRNRSRRGTRPISATWGPCSAGRAPLRQVRPRRALVGTTPRDTSALSPIAWGAADLHRF